jgi:hypothetical protein
LNDPQAATGAQLQSTPSFCESFVTIAVSGLVELTSMDEGGSGLKETVIGGSVMVIVAEANFVGSACEAAVTVTVPPLGTVAGAVYVVATSLAV